MRTILAIVIALVFALGVAGLSFAADKAVTGGETKLVGFSSEKAALSGDETIKNVHHDCCYRVEKPEKAVEPRMDITNQDEWNRKFGGG